MEKIFEGNGIIAFRSDSAIEIWNDDGDRKLGDMPLGTSTDALVCAGIMWHNGREVGVKVGIAQIRGQIKAALGL